MRTGRNWSGRRPSALSTSISFACGMGIQGNGSIALAVGGEKRVGAERGGSVSWQGGATYCPAKCRAMVDTRLGLPHNERGFRLGPRRRRR